MAKSFPFYKQHDAMDCGAACLRMIAKHYGKNFSLELLREKSHITREGVSMLGLSDAAEKIGFRTLGARLTFDKLCDIPFPCVVHWKQEHFIVVYDIKLKKKKKKKKNYYRNESSGNEINSNKAEYPKGTVFVADPGHGLIRFSVEEFLHSWISSKHEGKQEGIALLFEPTPDFYKENDDIIDKRKISFILQYLRPHRRLIVQLFLGMLLGTLIQLIFPFLTQGIVDYGINNNNLSFVTLILIAQLTLYVAQTAVDFIRSWILLHISVRINISIISDFLIKLMKLPIGYFDTKMIGDLMQRIGDHKRIEGFLTTSTLNTLFSMVNFVVFVSVLAFYNLTLLAIFLIASTFYVGWILIFLKRRRELDYKRFAQSSAEQSNLLQLITGMQEIKLNNCEKQKRWEWENIQARLYKVSIKGLALSQYQQSGAFFINETKNIIISFFAAKEVISGNMTLGMMMAVQYIIGQLNGPIGQLIGFIQSAQDAKISLERLGEIHNKEDEEDVNKQKIILLPNEKNIQIQKLGFQYTPLSPMVLQDLNLYIPEGKITAIVGMSGSGKTTLLKLLLGFYPPTQGEIRIGEINLQNISTTFWRNKCGAVMQEGFIFSESIAKNIAIGEDYIDPKRLVHAVKVANIQELIEELPLGFNTKIGQEGMGISQGQRQRILIARAVYKNPEFLFFDEATNALDANNEKVIMENLDQFFEGKTVVVVAHRLSTVKNADQIIVLNQGKITEIGTHQSLTSQKGEYYQLVKNQLELGNS